MRAITFLSIGLMAVVSAALLSLYAASGKTCTGCASMAITVSGDASGRVGGRGLENVSIKNFSFNLGEITVYLGDTVTWKNNDSVAHSSTSTTAIWDSGQLAGGESYSFTFTQLGEFPYYCSLHHDMRGKVIVVPLPAPVIDSPATATATVGALFRYQITAQFNPTNFAAVNLPAGLTIHQTSGVIEGTPSAAESGRAITLSATNATGTGQTVLTLNVVLPQAPVVTGAATLNGTVGTAFFHQIVASNNPGLYEADDLPASLSVNPATGVISGVPDSVEAGRMVTLRASNAGGTGTAVVSLTIQWPDSPTLNTSETIFAQAGEAFSYQVSASNNPTRFESADLPVGLSIDPTGLIQGVPSHPGIFFATVGASNAGGGGSGILKFEIAPAAPIALSSVLSVDALQGVPFTYILTASGNAPLTYQAQGLPAGLVLNQNRIEGTPLETGIHSVTLTVSNPYVSATSTLRMSVSDPRTTGDSDGDGFSDALEVSLGSLPLDAVSIPAGIHAGAFEPFDVARLQIHLNFKEPAADVVQVAGRILVTADFTPAQQTAVLDIGGLIHVLPLDGRGRTVATNLQFKLAATKAGGETFAFQFKASRRDFRTFFSNEGLGAESKVRNQSRTVTISLLVAGRAYTAVKTVRYTAKPGRYGTAR